MSLQVFRGKREVIGEFFRITDYQIGLHCLYSGKGGFRITNLQSLGGKQELRGVLGLQIYKVYLYLVRSPPPSLFSLFPFLLYGRLLLSSYCSLLLLLLFTLLSSSPVFLLLAPPPVFLLWGALTGQIFSRAVHAFTVSRSWLRS